MQDASWASAGQRRTYGGDVRVTRARRSRRGNPLRGRRQAPDAGEIAATLGTPPNYTGKTLRQLTRKGLLRSERGPHGGFALGVEPAELSVATLLDAVEEATPTQAACLLGDRPCDAADPCGAHARWMEVRNRTNELLTQTTLADLLGEDE